MNHSNTEDTHQPVSATNHVANSVEIPVDNLSQEAFDAAAGKEARLLVIGSATWPWQFAVAQAMIDWWVAADRPETRLIVDGRGPFTALAVESWNTERFDAEIHDVPPEAKRNPERRIKRAMTQPPPAHVIAFKHGRDPYVSDWLDYLRSLRDMLVDHGLQPFTVTLIQIDEVR